MEMCLSPTSGSVRPGFYVGGRSAGPGSTAGCSTPSVAPSRPGYDWVYAWPGPKQQQLSVNTHLMSLTDNHKVSSTQPFKIYITFLFSETTFKTA